MTVRLLRWVRGGWAAVWRAWPYDRRDALLAAAVGLLGWGLAGWDWRVAAVVLGVLGLGAWALPFVLLLWRRGGG